jgi:hypothetical protein
MKKAGWIMTGLLLAFLLPASVAPKLMGMDAATEALTAIGWSTDYLLMLGLLELGLLVLYVMPTTSLVGAVLFTALLGGTVASHLRAGSPLFSHTLFGVYLGIFLWVSLYLRDEQLRAYLQGRLPGQR